MKPVCSSSRPSGTDSPPRLPQRRPPRNRGAGFCPPDHIGRLLWIADTGKGIREEDKVKVLKRGFTTKPVGVGSGLGLPIVNRIVTEDHGGTVGFESEWGRGATFHIGIPLHLKKKGVE